MVCLLQLTGRRGGVVIVVVVVVVVAVAAVVIIVVVGVGWTVGFCGGPGTTVVL
jgi:hypothetical protein